MPNDPNEVTRERLNHYILTGMREEVGEKVKAYADQRQAKLDAMEEALANTEGRDYEALYKPLGRLEMHSCECGDSSCWACRAATEIREDFGCIMAERDRLQSQLDAMTGEGGRDPAHQPPAAEGSEDA